MSEPNHYWRPATFPTAHRLHPIPVAGYVYRGLGLHIVVTASPKGRRPPTWALTHLGSGHRVARIVGKVMQAFPIATEIAECCDWEFDGLDGWKNLEPELPQRLVDIAAKYPGIVTVTSNKHGGSEEAARAVLAINLAAGAHG